MLSQLLSFPVITMSTACIVAVYALVVGNDEGLKTAGVIGAIGGTSYQAESSLKLKQLRNKLDLLEDDQLDELERELEHP